MSGAPRPGRAPSAQIDSDDRDIAAARRVLRLEIDGLTSLGEMLDGAFIRALDLLQRVTGRVVVTGMGKSGHVANKIAATLASTGTPAMFVHPAEASHGDLGMVTRADAVLALSNSGETPELNHLVAYVKRFAIPLIAITRRPGSTLAEAADVALDLPASVEACPLGLAPTTSTTMMLALGDAIAIALLERKGFTTRDFQVLHPGGQLGAKLLRVADLMRVGDELPLIDGRTRMSDAIVEMTAKRAGCVGIVDRDGRLAGIITDGDLRRRLSADLLDQSAEAVMTRRPKTARPQMLAAEALGLMNSNNITNLFVLDGDRPVGIIHIHDLLHAGVA